MTLPSILKNNFSIPVIAAPLFIISNPDLVIAQCKSGVLGSFPALNARPQELLDDWLSQITEELDNYKNQNPNIPVAPYALNQMVLFAYFYDNNESPQSRTLHNYPHQLFLL